MSQDSSISVLACAECGRLDPGPREICPDCHAKNMVPTDVDGTGWVLSWTVIRRPPTRFREEAPYAVAVVDLDAGVRVVGRLRDPRDDLPPGAKVRCVGRHEDAAIFEEAREP